MGGFMDLELKKIGEKIKDSRKRKGLSQEKLSKMINVSRGYLSKIEKGGAVPSKYILSDIEKALNIELIPYKKNTDIIESVISELMEISKKKPTIWDMGKITKTATYPFYKIDSCSNKDNIFFSFFNDFIRDTINYENMEYISFKNDCYYKSYSFDFAAYIFQLEFQDKVNFWKKVFLFFSTDSSCNTFDCITSNDFKILEVFYNSIEIERNPTISSLIKLKKSFETVAKLK